MFSTTLKDAAFCLRGSFYFSESSSYISFEARCSSFVRDNRYPYSSGFELLDVGSYGSNVFCGKLSGVVDNEVEFFLSRVLSFYLFRLPEI